MSTRPTVFIVDSDQKARNSIEALVRTMHFEPETFASAEAFLLRRDPAKIGCAVVDLWLPEMNGIQLASHLADRQDPLPLILTGARLPVRTVVRAMQLGAVTFLEKPYPADDLCANIPAALELGRQRRARRTYLRGVRQRMDRLTPQEHQVLDYILAGFPNKVIARRLGVSLRTVEYRRHDIFVKTETDSLPELVRMVTDLEAAGYSQRGPAAADNRDQPSWTAPVRNGSPTAANGTRLDSRHAASHPGVQPFGAGEGAWDAQSSTHRLTPGS